jgi:ribosomal protein S18 acetylase RimI-like enzyme
MISVRRAVFPHDFERIQDIFFATSVRRDFSSNAERASFWEKWAAFYVKERADLISVACKGDRVVGYLMGSSESGSEHFADRFVTALPRFPAHFHINVDSEVQGHGVGTLLVSNFLRQLDCLGPPSIAGVHVITDKAADNVAFYRKLGFHYEVAHEDLLFMGRQQRLR